MTQHTVNALRLLCPMPVIRVQDYIERGLTDHSVSIGDQILTICSDPGAMQDIPAWAKVHGHKLLNTITVDGEYHVLIEVQASH